MHSDPLASFTPQVRNWFTRAFERPTEAQAQAWPAIARGENVLVSAPTGSGKTLAAFLWGLDRLAANPLPEGERRTRLVYVSPLKALSYDVEKNLRAPLKGIGGELAVAIRTGDTPQKERQAMLRKPPDVLITTPESLYLMLTSKAREFLVDAEAVIVDEIHAVARTKRGAHLALTLERLEQLADRPLQRIGLSATQRPLEEVGRFLVGAGRECTVIDAGIRKPLDLKIHVPVESMREPDAHDVTDPAYGGQGTAAGGGDLIGPGLTTSPETATSRSIWPAIYPELLRLIQEHRSTIVFVNSRRGAERLAVRLNDLAAEESERANGDGAPAGNGDAPAYIARAHHGSLAREERLIVEDLLKSGELPCLVATSSLELGIDMGAVDLVIQVESPKSVTAGLQRIGRAGHGVGEVSRGRIFPKFRADLLECAVVAKRMRDGEIEPTVVPRNPLDVLAQQIVAMTATGDELKVPLLHETVRRAYPFAELSRELLDSVLDMLDGRYPSEEFAELRPRIVWDRVEDTIRARRGALQLAVTNAGTIPDRGLYGVHLPDGRRVGELDEEMVYEARPGQTFLLGASTWRIEEITRDRVIVTPAPGAPGAVPFWKGDGIGRPKELGLAIGAFARESVDRDPAELAAEYDLDERAANNLSAFLREQRDATRVVPSDRTIVVERFRDEIGDWRLCVLSPFGGRVHSAWALALSARIRDEFGLESDAIWSDDGIIVHLPDADEPPSADLLMVEPDAVEDMVVRELSGSALFGARFRENAARALLLPRAYPGKRTPLWQQRLKAQSLLEVAKRYGQFPIVLETYRECLQDVLDLPGLEQLLRGLHTRELSLVEVETQRASPFASSLLFDYVATYMYEGDTPERRAARRGAVARPRPAARAARPGGAARADRPGRARGGRGRPPAHERAHPRRELGRAARRAARGRRPDRRRGAGALPASRGRRADPRRAREGAARRPDADRRRGALDRLRGRGPLPRRPRRRAARRAAGRVPRGGRGAARSACAALRAHARAVHHARDVRSLWARPRARCSASSSERATSCAASCGRAAASASGATPTCCAACAAPRSPRSARRSSPPSSARWRASCPRGREWTERRPAAPAWIACARCWCRSRGLRSRRRSGSATCFRAGWARTPPPGWTSSARAASWCGWAPGRSGAAPAGWRCCSARTPAGSGPPPFKGERPERRSTTRSASGSSGGAAFWTDLLVGPRRGGAGRAPGGALGPRLGRRGHQRRVRAAARAAAALAKGDRQAGPPLRPPPPPRCAAGAGPLVAHRAAVRRSPRARPAHARDLRAAARAPRDRDPRGGAGRGRARRLRRALLRADEPGDARHGPARLLRRGARRRPVRAARGDRAPAQPALGRARRRRSSSPPPTRRTRTARRCPGRSARTTTPAAGPPACRAPTS